MGRGGGGDGREGDGSSRSLSHKKRYETTQAKDIMRYICPKHLILSGQGKKNIRC